MSTDTESGLRILEALDAAKPTSITAIEKDQSNRAKFPGFPYEIEARTSNIVVAVDIFKSGYECKTCKGTGAITTFEFIPGQGQVPDEIIVCEDCHGKGALLHLADESKSLPCTGVVVSVGPLIENKESLLYKRVLFGPHSGRFIPISKAGVLMKIMDQREATAFIYGGEDLAAFDFIDIDKDMGA
jgi:hypothetical protein